VAVKSWWKTALIAILALVALAAAPAAPADEKIPAAAWRRGIGVPLENAGTEKPGFPYPHFDDGYWQGAPVGGFGAGTFSRTYRGDFARWHIKTGIHKYETVWANQFAVYQRAEGASAATAQVLFAGRPEGPALSAWKWDYPAGAGSYAALYPKSWYDYEWSELPVRLVLEQFSPVLPHNYRETSYPVAVYHWHAHNPSNRRVTVAVMLSWANMVGWFRDGSAGFAGANNMGNINRVRAEAVNVAGQGARMKGLVFDRVRQDAVTEEWDGQFVIAALEQPGVEVSYHATFSPISPAAEVWTPFAASGKLSNADRQWASSGEPLAGAIAVTFTLEPGERRTVPMVIAWDLPVVQFGQGRKWHRRYTDFFGASGQAGWEIAREALASGAKWSREIDEWQRPFVTDESKPLWYRGMLFNETYNLADLGTFWGRQVGAPKSTPPTYSFLECFDYAYYETLDVRFYGSMGLAKWWPEIEKQVMRDFADTVTQDLTETYVWMWKTQQTGEPHFRTRKARGAVPHDFGHPAEDPFAYVNQFSWQYTDRWKDLNSKFVLLVWRDYVFSGASDTDFLRYTWPAVEEAIEYLRQFDTNGNGLPENEGFPDQTYDVWVVEGESAYCGGLFLAALRAAEEIAKKLGHADRARHYRELFTRAQKAYIDLLWNGEYFRYDTKSVYRDNVMADQLAGQWYANLTGLGDIVPREMRLSALKKIFANNVMKFEGGRMGAVNGIAADGTIITTNEQVEEVWTGTTLGLASFMLSEGLREEGFRTAWGIYHVVYERYGYWFRTPEAWDRHGLFRASMYMRPGAIWAMEMAPAP
jgi:non-lysosomal glucosylceramidase